jgi:hypothetical protein
VQFAASDLPTLAKQNSENYLSVLAVGTSATSQRSSCTRLSRGAPLACEVAVPVLQDLDRATDTFTCLCFSQLEKQSPGKDNLSPKPQPRVRRHQQSCYSTSCVLQHRSRKCSKIPVRNLGCPSCCPITSTNDQALGYNPTPHRQQQLAGST